MSLMDDMLDVGEMIGRALANKGAPSFVINEPDLRVEIDAKPIADAVISSAERSGRDIATVVERAMVSGAENFLRGMADAVAASPVADMDGVEARLSALTLAVRSIDFAPVAGAVAAALDRQTAETARAASATEALVDALRENTAAIRAERTVAYDAEGRVTSVRVGR